VVELRRVSVVHDGTAVLAEVDWLVEAGQHWVVIGPNGSGKTTLLELVGARRHPSSGSATVLGQTLGRTDVRDLRRRIGYTGATLGRSLRPALSALEVVATARHAALEPWWHRYASQDWDRAGRLLEEVGCGPLASRAVGTLSEGERQRVLLARAFMVDPGLVVLDEPAAGLAAGGRGPSTPGACRPVSASTSSWSAGTAVGSPGGPDQPAARPARPARSQPASTGTPKQWQAVPAASQSELKSWSTSSEPGQAVSSLHSRVPSAWTTNSPWQWESWRRQEGQDTSRNYHDVVLGTVMIPAAGLGVQDDRRPG